MSRLIEQLKHEHEANLRAAEEAKQRKVIERQEIQRGWNRDWWNGTGKHLFADKFGLTVQSAYWDDAFNKVIFEADGLSWTVSWSGGNPKNPVFYVNTTLGYQIVNRRSGLAEMASAGQLKESM